MTDGQIVVEAVARELIESTERLVHQYKIGVLDQTVLAPPSTHDQLSSELAVGRRTPLGQKLSDILAY